MCCMRLAGNEGRKKIAKKSLSGHHRTTLSGYIFATKALTIGKNLLSSNISSTCPHSMVPFFPLATDIDWRVWAFHQISTAFASWLRYCSDVAQRKPAKLCTMFGRLLGCYTMYIHCRGLLPPNGILPGAKCTLRTSLAFSYTVSVTARLFSSGRQPNFAALSEDATYIRQCGLHVGHWPTF